MDTANTNLPLPLAYWGLDPLYKANVKVSISCIHRMAPYPDLPGTFFHHGHPISSVELCGHIVSIAVKESRVLFTVDDGTATVPCLVWYDQGAVACTGTEEAAQNLRLGDLVVVCGLLGTYRDALQVIVTNLRVETDLCVEMVAWLEAAHLAKTTYWKPFVLPRHFTAGPAASSVGGKGDAAAEGGTGGGGGGGGGGGDGGGGGGGGDEEDLRSAVVAHFEERMVEGVPAVPFQAVVQDVGLRALAEYVLAGTASDVPTDTRVRHLFTRTMARLVRDGVLFVENDEEDVYAYITHARTLAPAIVDFIREKSGRGSGVGRGVPQTAVVAHVQRGRSLRHVPRKRIVESIDALLTDSVIYEVQPMEYKLTLE